MTIEDAERWQEKGVVIIDHNTTYLEEDVCIGENTIIYPNVSIRGKSIIGKNNIIESNTIIIDAIIGNNNKVISSHLNGVKIGDNNRIGPFCNLHDNVDLADNNRVGNFVEIKNCIIGSNNAFKHLSYLGDSEIKNGINFSAGAITANFNWIDKTHNKTIIEDEVMVGANAVLVAPVTLKRQAFVAAGSVIDVDVPEKALAVARPRPQIKENFIEEKKDESN